MLVFVVALNNITAPFPLLDQLRWAIEDVKLASRDTADIRSRKKLERLHYSQLANLSCVGDSAGCVIAGNLTLTGHFYWLEEQLSAGHFGTDLDHSRCTTSVADGAYLMTCMIGGSEDICVRLV